MHWHDREFGPFFVFWGLNMSIGLTLELITKILLRWIKLTFEENVYITGWGEKVENEKTELRAYEKGQNSFTIVKICFS